jgi:DNA polymerase elongation subunit (family B)
MAQAYERIAHGNEWKSLETNQRRYPRRAAAEADERGGESRIVTRDAQNVSPKCVRSKVERAVKRLLKKDAVLIDVDVNERSITHHLAVYLGQEFTAWHVDVEYNRNLRDIKRLCECVTQPTVEDTDAVTVYPDIIVHKRDRTDNLLVVEVKKAGRGGCELDIRKLKAFTDQSPGGQRYRCGVHITLPQKPADLPSLRWFVNGAELDVDK